MIDLKTEVEKYKKIELNSLEYEGTPLPENLKNSITLYNNALDHLNKGSEDIAVIQLKRAVKLNKSLYEAMNVLGVCYVNCGEFEKGINLFKRVVKEERNSVLALKYLSSLNHNDDCREMGVKVNDKPITLISDISEEKSTIGKFFDWIIDAINMNKSYRGENKKFIFGMFCGAMIICVLGIYFYFSLEFDKVATNISVSTENRALNEKNLLIDNLNKEVSSIKESNDKLLKANVSMQNFQKICQVEKYAEEGKNIEAYDLMVSINPTSELDIWKLNKIKVDITKNATETAFNEGMSFYKTAKYAEAIDRFNKSVKYTETWDKTPDLLYHLGVSQNNIGEKEEALKNLQVVVDKYPRYVNFWNAKNLINFLKRELGR